MSKILSILFIIIGYSIPAINFWDAGYSIISIALVTFLIIGILSRTSGYTWLNSLILFLGVAINAAGIWFDFSPILTILSTIFILTGWDFTNYSFFIGLAAPSDPITVFEKYHLINILYFLILSTVISIISITFQFTIKFFVAVILVILLVIIFIQINRWIQDSTEMT